MMRKKEQLILMYICVCTWLSTLLALSMPRVCDTNEETASTTVLIDSIETTPSVNLKDNIKNELIVEAENYIYRKFPKTHKTIPTSIVENGLKEEIDILFMMAQTQIETSFGTAGAGRETSRRSLFGVAIRKYDTYDKAIKDYIAILKKNYLTRGRTEQHLMKKYTTTRGGRYADNPKYEVELRNAYADINRKTNIKLLQDKYKNLNIEDSTEML